MVCILRLKVGEEMYEVRDTYEIMNNFQSDFTKEIFVEPMTQVKLTQM